MKPLSALFAAALTLLAASATQALPDPHLPGDPGLRRPPGPPVYRPHKPVPPGYSRPHRAPHPRVPRPPRPPLP